MALDAESAPTVGVKVASKLAGDAANALPAATEQQIAAFQAIVAEMKAHDAQLTAALATKEAEAQQAKADAATAKVQAQQSALAAHAATADASTKSATLAKTAAVLDGQTAENVTLWQRIKAIGGASVLLFILIPLVAIAFPEFAPILKVACAPLLKLWQVVHNRELVIVAAMHAKAAAEALEAKTQLSSEKEAHAATKDMLVKMSSTT
jgi:hypothetical protein